MPVARETHVRISDSVSAEDASAMALRGVHSRLPDEWVRGLLFDGRAENVARTRVAMRVLRKVGVGVGMFCAWWADGDCWEKSASIELKVSMSC